MQDPNDRSQEINTSRRKSLPPSSAPTSPYCCSPLILKNSLYFGAHLLRHALPQSPIGTAAAVLNITKTP
jgi:hypothetical protein